MFAPFLHLLPLDKCLDHRALTTAIKHFGWVGVSSWGRLQAMDHRSVCRNCSLAPYHQFANFDFTSGDVILENGDTVVKFGFRWELSWMGGASVVCRSRG